MCAGRRPAVSTTCGASQSALYARGLDHLAPLLGFVGDELPEVGGRAGQRCATQLGKPRLDLGVGEARVDLPVELIDNLEGRVPGCDNAEPNARLVTGHKIAQ